MATASQPILFQLDNFEYDCENDWLGAGTFGDVFRCRLKDSGKQVAVKMLSSQRTLKRSEERSFLSEVSILHRLTECPHVVRLLGLCTDPGNYAIVMEYVENGDLKKMLLSAEREHGEIRKWSCRINMSLDIAKGMDFLHSRSPPIIHRDLKTSNVVVDRNYCCKIIDFGLSAVRGVSRQSEVQSSSSSKGMGTVAFTAPELLLKRVDEEHEKKIDVYSYSIILWQLKERKPVYDGMSRAMIIASVTSKIRPHLSDDDCSEGFRHLIIRCWSDQPNARLTFREIITMFEGIMGQTSTCLLCSQNSHDEVLRAANPVMELNFVDAIGSASVQSVSHTKSSPSVSMLLESVGKSSLESTSSIPVFTSFNLVPPSVPTEKKTDEQSDISNFENEESNQRKARKFPKVIFVIDMELLGYSDEVTLTAQTTVNLSSIDDLSNSYRIAGIYKNSIPLGEVYASHSFHLPTIFQAAGEVLTDIRCEVDGAKSTHPLEVDVWVHLGQQIITNVDNSEACSTFSVGSVLSNVRKRKGGSKWIKQFKAGLQVRDMVSFNQRLNLNAEATHSSTRHDFRFVTPSGRQRRFKVWIPENQENDTGPGQAFCVRPVEQQSVEGGQKVGCGVFLFPHDKRLVADVALPDYPFDCRLLIRTGVTDVTDQSKQEKAEDVILMRYYLEKVRIFGKDVDVPPMPQLPANYQLLYHRKCERQSYRFGDFELTVSREKTLYSVDEEAQETIDVHIHSIGCDYLLQQNRGRDWKPEDILWFIPEILNCAKSIHHLFL